MKSERASSGLLNFKALTLKDMRESPAFCDAGVLLLPTTVGTHPQFTISPHLPTLSSKPPEDKTTIPVSHDTCWHMGESSSKLSIKYVFVIIVDN